MNRWKNQRTKKPENIEPIPEQVAVDDPIQILSRVTLESARLERQVFEQPWELKKAPFYVKDKSFIYKYNIANKIVKITVNGNGKIILLSKNMTGNSINFDLPEGRWKMQFYTEQNHIRDTYFGYVQVDAKGNPTIENELWRYTTLQVQPKVTENIKPIDSFKDTYLKAGAEKSGDGKIIFTFSGDSLAKGRHMSINLSYELPGSMGNESADFWGGKDQKIYVSWVVPLQDIYYFESTIIDPYVQDTIKGEIKLDPATGIKILFNCAFHKFTNKGFVYTD